MKLSILALCPLAITPSFATFCLLGFDPLGLCDQGHATVSLPGNTVPQETKPAVAAQTIEKETPAPPAAKTEEEKDDKTPAPTTTSSTSTTSSRQTTVVALSTLTFSPSPKGSVSLTSTLSTNAASFARVSASPTPILFNGTASGGGVNLHIALGLVALAGGVLA